MKKAMALVLFAATVFTLAACAKKGERYQEPPTEIITLDNGGRAVYEVVTDEQGEPQTDKEGKTVYRPYDPPVTKKGGYLVTDAEGSTIKRSDVTEASVTVDSDFGVGVLDSVDDQGVPETDAKGQTVAPQTNAEGKTVAATAPEAGTGGSSVTNGNGSSIGIGSTTIGSTENDNKDKDKDKDKDKQDSTTIPQLEHASTVAYNGTLTKGKAIKLMRILDAIENPFEEDLVDSKYEEARESINVYINNTMQAQKEIQADPELYAFVTKSNIEYWNYYLTQMKIKYSEFASIVAAQKPGEKPSSSVYSSYVAFQNEYRKEIEVYYSIYDAAREYVK